jgi:hypothetical protein
MPSQRERESTVGVPKIEGSLQLNIFQNSFYYNPALRKVNICHFQKYI